jgi:hypothetical protein
MVPAPKQAATTAGCFGDNKCVYHEESLCCLALCAVTIWMGFHPECLLAYNAAAAHMGNVLLKEATSIQ